MVKIIPPSYEILDDINAEVILKRIEAAGRTCYKSEDKITKGSHKKFVKMVLDLGHESVIEHEKVSVRIICDRGVTHEIVRHRLASYSQESTRYCNYGKGKFGEEITVIDPKPFMNEIQYKTWLRAVEHAENAYLSLISTKAPPQMARSVLPNSLKTEIVCTFNIREWRHFFTLRASPKAHPQMRQIVVPMLMEFKEKIPVIFDDINPSCVDCINLGEAVECTDCADGKGWPCKIDKNGQHVHPDMCACVDFKSKW